MGLTFCTVQKALNFEHESGQNKPLKKKIRFSGSKSQITLQTTTRCHPISEIIIKRKKKANDRTKSPYRNVTQRGRDSAKRIGSSGTTPPWLITSSHTDKTSTKPTSNLL